MPIPLRDAMREILDGWEQDLAPAWRGLLVGAPLGFEDIASELMLEPWEPVFPARKGRIFPGAPKGAHIFRAFEGISLERVRCLILGQDPYPCPAFATGRAFEAGNVALWREFEKMFSHSMRTLLQLIVVARTGDETYGRSVLEWPRLITDIEAGRVTLPKPAEIADSWVAQGVLLLNSSLTLSRFAVEGDPHQLRGHLPLWRPLVIAVVRALMARAQPLVIIGFGAQAAEVLRACDIAQVADGRVAGHGAVACLPREHPARGDALLAQPNPFQACNRLLASMNATPIAW